MYIHVNIYIYIYGRVSLPCLHQHCIEGSSLLENAFLINTSSGAEPGAEPTKYAKKCYPSHDSEPGAEPKNKDLSINIMFG